jgi:O-acetylhomoserine (thiol)-lyase
MFIQGLETLFLRIRQHSANASAVADYLSRHPKVTNVIHPSQQSGDDKRMADKYLNGGYGSLVGFELGSGSEAGQKFIDNLEMFYHVANIGDARSLAIHPATTTHSQLTPEEQQQTGVTPGYVRLSIGIEHIDDIIGDLEQALAEVESVEGAALSKGTNEAAPAGDNGPSRALPIQGVPPKL